MAASALPIPPDELRCRRSDGRGWRCKSFALPGFPNCDHHLSKSQRRRLEEGKTPLPLPLISAPPPPPPLPPSSNYSEPSLLDSLAIFNFTKKKRSPRIPFHIVHENLPHRVLSTDRVLGISQNVDDETRSNPSDVSHVTLGLELPNYTTLEGRECGHGDVGTTLENERYDRCGVMGSTRASSPCSQGVPLEIRCQRTDGKQWRCRRPAMENHDFCEHHHIQALRNRRKLHSTGAVKIRRGRPPLEKNLASSMVRKRRKQEEEHSGCVVEGERKKRSGKPLVALVNVLEPQVTLNSQPMDDSTSVPDHLRCRRTDGKQWRCSHRALDNLSFCDIHHIQAHRRQYKLGVPDHMKLKRRPRGPTVNGRCTNRVIGKLRVDMNEDDLKRAVKLEKRRKENETLLEEVMRLVLQRQVEKRRKEQKRREEQGEMEQEMIKKVLPNGLMSISPPVSGYSDYVGRHLDMKVGLDSSSFLRWCFRSKNVDPPPIGSLQRLPFARKALGLAKRRRRVCHHCKIAIFGRMLRCSHCRKTFFCKKCIKKWYSGLSESDVRTSCPVCRGKCLCTVCTSSKTATCKSLLGKCPNMQC